MTVSFSHKGVWAVDNQVFRRGTIVMHNSHFFEFFNEHDNTTSVASFHIFNKDLVLSSLDRIQRMDEDSIHGEVSKLNIVHARKWVKALIANGFVETTSPMILSDAEEIQFFLDEKDGKFDHLS